MKKHILHILFATTLFVTVGCQKVIEFEVDEITPFPTMNAVGEVDSSLSVRLTWSRFFLDEHAFPVIDDASITLMVNGTPYATPASFDGKNYTFGYKPIPGDSLTIQASIPGRDNLVASTRVPERPKVHSASVSLESAEYYENKYKLRFVLDDAPTPHTCYSLRLYLVDSSFYWHSGNDTVVYDTSWYSSYISFEVNDPMLMDQNGIASGVMDDNYYTNFFFTDDRFNGKEHAINLSFYNYNNSYDWGDEFNGGFDRSRIFLIVTTYSYDLYRYIQQTGGADDFSELVNYFNEPTQVHTNVQGGMGIFGIKSTRIIELQLPTQDDNNKKIRRK